MNTDYRQIVAVTGLPGLYQLVSTKNDGAIVKNLADNAIKFVAARKHQVTPLESIEIYTTSDNIRLHEVFEKMKTDDAEVPQLAAKKDNEANKTYFKRILPDYDADRVYTSDINKVIKWYELLKNKDLLNFDYLKATEGTEEGRADNDAANDAANAVEGTAKNENATEPVKKESTKKTKAKKETDETEASGTTKTSAAKKSATGKTAAGKTAAEKDGSAVAKEAEAKEAPEKAPAKKAAPKKKAAEAAGTATPKKTAPKKKKEEG